MKVIHDILHEVRVLDDGAVFVRRKDGRALTPADYRAALRLADSEPGITAADVLRVFPGAKAISQRK